MPSLHFFVSEVVPNNTTCAMMMPSTQSRFMNNSLLKWYELMTKLTIQSFVLVSLLILREVIYG